MYARLLLRVCADDVVIRYNRAPESEALLRVCFRAQHFCLRRAIQVNRSKKMWDRSERNLKSANPRTIAPYDPFIVASAAREIAIGIKIRVSGRTKGYKKERRTTGDLPSLT